MFYVKVYLTKSFAISLMLLASVFVLSSFVLSSCTTLFTNSHSVGDIFQRLGIFFFSIGGYLFLVAYIKEAKEEILKKIGK